MTLKALTSHIVTGVSGQYWGKIFTENGLSILLETIQYESKPAHVSGPVVLDTLLTSYTNFASHNLSSIARMLSDLEGKKEIKTLVIGIQKDDQIFLGSLGEGEVLLIRGESVGTILKKGEVSHGQLKAGDLLIFYPEIFRKIYTDSQIPPLVSPFYPIPLGEKIEADIKAYPDVTGLSLLITHFSETTFSKKNKAALFLHAVDKIKTIPSIGKSIFMRIFGKDEDGESAQFVPEEKEKKSKRVLLLISGVLVLLLVGSVFFNIHRTRDMKKQRQLTDSLTLISHQYEESSSLIDLNPIRARTLLSESKSTLSSLLGQFSQQSPEYKQVQEWLDKISQKETEAYKIFKLTAVPVFFDVTFLRSDALADRVAGYKTTKAFLDTQNHLVYVLDTVTKGSSIIAGNEIVKDAHAIAVHGNNVFIINTDGVIQIDIKSKTAKTVIRKDEDWGEIAAIASYGGNIYLLDRVKNTVWKYIATESGFSNKSTYINPGVKVNFSNTQTLVIDGNVWVLFSDGVAKYARGVNDQFVVSGFSDTLSGLKSFSTDETDKHLYVLDTMLSRIIVFDKEGVYQSQYQWENLKNATDIIASEEEKKIFVNIASKIYAIDIK